jgi:hypothetical protein
MHDHAAAAAARPMASMSGELGATGLRAQIAAAERRSAADGLTLAPAGTEVADRLAEKASAEARFASDAPPTELGGFQRFWRDFGVHPQAMIERVLIKPPPAPGAPLEGGRPADAAVLDQFRGELRAVLEKVEADSGQGLSKYGMIVLEQEVADVAAKYGVPITFAEGAPTTSWGEFPTIEVEREKRHAHELVHAIQFAIGAVATLSTAAGDRIAATEGRVTDDPAELRAAMEQLTPQEKNLAYQTIVQPMDDQASAHLERGAFEAVGAGGSKVPDAEAYKQALLMNVDAYVDAYKLASAPDMDVAFSSKAYGMIGHVARTHGENFAVLFPTVGAAAAGVAAATAVNPALGLAAAAPLAYGAFKAITG